MKFLVEQAAVVYEIVEASSAGEAIELFADSDILIENIELLDDVTVTEWKEAT